MKKPKSFTNNNFIPINDVLIGNFRRDFSSEDYFTDVDSKSIYLIDSQNPLWCREIKFIDKTQSYQFRDLQSAISLHLCEIDILPFWITEFGFVDFIPDIDLEEVINIA